MNRLSALGPGVRMAVACASCALTVAGAALGATRPAPVPPSVVLNQSRIFTLQDLSALLSTRTRRAVVVGEAYRKRTLFISAGRYPVADLLAAVESATGLVVRKIGGIDMLTAPNARQIAQGRLPILPAPLLARLNKDLQPLGENVDLEKEGVPFPTSLFLQGKTVAYKSLSATQQHYIMKLVILHDWGG